MKGGYGSSKAAAQANRWNVVCCKNGKGACEHCARRGVVAYVVGMQRFNQPENVKRKSTWMRVCDYAWKLNKTDKQLALTLTHELIHMTSSVVDNSYRKSKMVKNAQKDPALARLNSDSYTHYIAQTGLPRSEYLKLTKRSGGAQGESFAGFTGEGEGYAREKDGADCQDSADNCA